MSWLRIDDGFSRHPKVTALTHKQRWIWLDILCYSARYQTDGWLPENIREHIAGATDPLVEKCLELGLLDDDEAGIRIHDWRSYAPKDITAAERQAAWRRRHRNGNVTAEVTGNVTADDVTKPSTSRAGAARVPVPSPSSLSPSAVASYPPAGRKDEIEAHRIEPLAQLAAAAHADDDIPL